MRFASLIPVLFFLQSHAQLQTYSLKGELALSGLISSDVPKSGCMITKLIGTNMIINEKQIA